MIEAVVFIPARLRVPEPDSDVVEGGVHSAVVRALLRAARTAPNLGLGVFADGQTTLTPDHTGRTPWSPGWWSADVLIDRSTGPITLDALPGIRPGRYLRQGCPRPLQGPRWAIGAAARQAPMAASWRSLTWRGEGAQLAEMLRYRGPMMLVASVSGPEVGISARDEAALHALGEALRNAEPGTLTDTLAALSLTGQSHLLPWLDVLKLLLQDAHWVGEVFWSGFCENTYDWVAVWTRVRRAPEDRSGEPASSDHLGMPPQIDPDSPPGPHGCRGHHHYRGCGPSRDVL